MEALHADAHGKAGGLVIGIGSKVVAVIRCQNVSVSSYRKLRILKTGPHSPRAPVFGKLQLHILMH